MYNVERNAIDVVAKLRPWLAPFPSAYFVARSAMVHLNLPLAVAVVVAAIVETLGLATVHRQCGPTIGMSTIQVVSATFTGLEKGESCSSVPPTDQSRRRA